MPKNSKAGALKTEALVYQTIIDLFFEDGWDAVTYGAIAKRTGLSRSGIQRVVPSKESMVEAFQGQIIAYILQELENDPDTCIKSVWLRALGKKPFAHCVRFLLGAPNLDAKGKEKVAAAVALFKARFGEAVVVELIGLSLLHLLNMEKDRE